MKKILILLISTTLTLFACEKKISDSSWIAVKSYSITGEEPESKLDGMTIDFSDSSLKISNVLNLEYYDFYDLSIKNNKIILDNEFWANIFAEHKDSLILDFDKKTRAKFVKLENQPIILNQSEFWKHKNWIINTKEYQRELILTDLMYATDQDVMVCIQKDIKNNKLISTIDKWTIVNINNNQLFVRTPDKEEQEFYKIKSYVDDSIIQLVSLKSQNITAELIKKQYISKSERESIYNQIQSKNWKTDKVLIMDTVSSEYRNWRVLPLNSKLFREKKYSFNFLKDSTYTIYKSNTSVEKGNWKLSLTGDEIILNSGSSPSDYIYLLNLHTDSLTIGGIRRFEHEKNGHFVDTEIYYKIKLKE